jgi:uroporphyrinogen decarboxylase
MNSRERVKRAIHFDGPDRTPVWLFNRDVERGDVIFYDFRVDEGDSGSGYHGAEISEWGYRWQRLNDGTMGQPLEPMIPDINQLDRYKFPELKPEKRLRGLTEYKARSEGYYRLPLLVITGFTTYTFLRGFENAMLDLLLEPEKSATLLDGIFGFEKQLMTLAAEAGFDGFHFGDDWGTQDSTIISGDLWREVFKPRYRDQFEHCQNLGLDVWFHSCGNIADLVPDFHEIGVDVMNLAQPNVYNDLASIANKFHGKQCFMVPVSYQTTGISGTPEEILSQTHYLEKLFGTEKGGFIGYIEEYSCMGMSEDNYQAHCRAFGR